MTGWGKTSRRCITGSFACHFIHVPGLPENQRPRRLGADDGHPATTLDYFQVPPLKGIEGRSLLPVVNQDKVLHDAVLFGIFGGHERDGWRMGLYGRPSQTPDNQPLAGIR